MENQSIKDSKLIRMFILPLIIMFITALSLNLKTCTILISILLIDVYFAMIIKFNQVTKRNVYLVKRVKCLTKLDLYLPFFGYCCIGSNGDVNKALERIKQSSESGYIFWYILYITEYILHFLVLLVFFRSWYYEEYQDNMEKFSVKFRTLHKRAVDNVCFNEVLQKCLNCQKRYDCSKPYNWLPFLTNETR